MSTLYEHADNARTALILSNLIEDLEELIEDCDHSVNICFCSVRMHIEEACGSILYLREGQRPWFCGWCGTANSANADVCKCGAPIKSFEDWEEYLKIGKSIQHEI